MIKKKKKVNGGKRKWQTYIETSYTSFQIPTNNPTLNMTHQGNTEGVNLENKVRFSTRHPQSPQINERFLHFVELIYSFLHTTNFPPMIQLPCISHTRPTIAVTIVEPAGKSVLFCLLLHADEANVSIQYNKMTQ